MKRKIVAVALFAVLAVSVSLALLYFRSLNEQEKQPPYTVIGTLGYAPWHAITPGVSVISVNPSLSPNPSNLTWSEPEGKGGYYNYTVDAFMFVSFKSNFTIPSGFPKGFEAGSRVKLKGEISYDETSQRYAMNVTSIFHYVS